MIFCNQLQKATRDPMGVPWIGATTYTSNLLITREDPTCVIAPSTI